MGFQIVIKTKGLDKLPEKLARVRVGVLARVAQMLQLIGQEVVSISKEEYLSGPRPKNLGPRTGQLRVSVNYKVSGNRVVIGSNLPYARIHELGGDIVPKRAPFLVFNIPGVGWRRSKKVTIKPRPYLEPALKDSIPGAKSIIQRLANEVLLEALA